ncbi:FMN-binding protein [Paenibacillus filicis]|uniref:FMN-binding protein n=1 Tax=Paenibacillus filicis TaxID=669464 RepID=A0ABU9DE29_9BACL
MAANGKALILLCSTAIGIIYTAGYSVTQPMATLHAAEKTAIQGNDKVAEQSVAKSKYKDGTFAGSGTNRFGTVDVDVTITHGKITAVEITRSATRYPERYIDALPGEVIARQSAQIDTVSGATRSSEDFINAVLAALRQAEQT